MTGEEKQFKKFAGGGRSYPDRGLRGRIKDRLYECTRRLLWKNGPRPHRRGYSAGRGAKIFLVTMLTVPIVHWLVFWLYVNINSIAMAFQLPSGEWSLHQFRTLFYELGRPDSQIVIAFRNTLIYFANSVCIVLPLALGLSYLFYKKIFMYKTFRVVLYCPAIISAVAMTSAFSNIVSPVGPLGYILEKMGVNPAPELLADSRYATWTMVFYCAWTGIGTGTLLFQGAMARIPVDVLEASRLDGCQAGTELVRIIIPLIWPTISTQLILTLTGMLTATGPILLLTMGEHDTTTLAFWIFYNVKYTGSLNQVAAAGLFFTTVSVPVILTIRWLIEKVPAVEY